MLKGLMERLERMDIDEKKILYGRAMMLFVVFVLVLATALHTSERIRDAAAANVHELAENRLSAAAARIESDLNAAKGILWAAAGAVGRMVRDGGTSGDILRYITEATERYERLFGRNYTGLYGYIGGEYLDGVGWTPPAGFDPTARPWYSAAINADGKAVIVSPYTDAQTHMTIVSLSTMLSNGRYVLALDMNMMGIEALMNGLQVMEKGYGFILDEDGTIIAHRDVARAGRSLNGTDEELALARRILETRNGNFEMLLDGKESTVFVHEVMGQWRLAMIVGHEDLSPGIQRQLGISVLICAVLFFAIARFYYLDFKNERDRLRRMQEMMIEKQRQTYEAKALRLEKDAAEQANRAKSNFLAEMSHEIRTPINAVLGMNEMILRESGDEAVREYARGTERAGRSLLGIINDILDFSRIETGRMEIVCAPYRLSSLLNDVCDIALSQACSKNLAFDAEVDGTMPDVLLGDEARIRQVITNVLSNAVKYTNEGGVTLRARGTRDGDALNLLVSVADTGIGIREEDMNILFEKFARVDLERNKTVEGTGLGLAITQNLLRLMNGSIRVESEYGRGSVFTVAIPQRIVSDEPVGDFRETRTRGPRNATRESFRAPDARVLAVDDTEMNLAVIRGLLQETELRIDTAVSGAEALRLTKETRYDLILMDQRMPGMDGTETLRRIRGQEGGLNNETPVICLTADAVQRAEERYLAQGFTGYISKPVEGAALEAALMERLPAEKVIRVQRESAAKGPEREQPGQAVPVTAEGLSPEEALEEIRTRTPEWLASYRALAGVLRPYFEAQDGPRAAEDLPGMDAEELRELYDGILEFAKMYDLDSIARLLKQAEGRAIPEAERERFAHVKERAQSSDWAGLEAVLKGKDG